MRRSLRQQLMLSFTLILTLGASGAAFALRQFYAIEKETARIVHIDQQALLILRVSNDLATYHQKLSQIAAGQQAAVFIQRAQELREVIAGHLQAAKASFNGTGSARDANVRYILSSARHSVPDNIQALTALARAGDWQAIDLQIDSAGRRESYRMEMLVRDLDDSILELRTEVLAKMLRARQRAVSALLASLLLTVALTIVLAIRFIRSIAGPLLRLQVSSRAIADGDFSLRIQETSGNEFDDVSGAFNDMAMNLSKLYERVSQSEAHFRSLIEHAVDLIFVVDQNGHFLYVSPSVERFVGQMAATIKSALVTDLLCFPEDSIRQTFFGPPNAWTSLQDFELILLDNDERHIYLEATASNRFLDPAVGGIVINARDITRKKAAQAEILRLNEELEQRVSLRTAELQDAKELAEAANKAKSEFLANMSHEIRTPMNGVIGMAELAIEAQSENERTECLRTVVKSGHNLLAIINDVLDFSKIEAGKLTLRDETFSLRDCLADTLRTVAVRALEKQLEFFFEVDANVPDVVGSDSGRLAQIILNLIGNAIKFTAEGGITLSVRHSPKGCDRDGSVRLEFTIQDTGIGIDPAQQSAIFEPFTQADNSSKRQYGGTGLGLSICRKLVAMLGGEIGLQSEPGVGTTVTFDAVLAVRQAWTSPLLASPGQDAFRILVVDGSIRGSGMLVRTLTAWGAATILARDEEAAIQALQAPGELFAAVVLNEASLPEYQRVAAAAQRSGCPKLIILRDPIPRAVTGERNVAGQVVICPFKHDDLFTALSGVSKHKTPQDREAEKLTGSSAQSRLRILLAEDNAVNQLVARRMLEKMGHSVTLAENGLLAVEAWRKSSWDLVLMDVQMPVMDGLEAVAVIRREEAELSASPQLIVAMTAHSLDGDRERFLQAGMDDYISKPVSSKEIHRVLSRLSARQELAPAV